MVGSSRQWAIHQEDDMPSARSHTVRVSIVFPSKQSTQICVHMQIQAALILGGVHNETVSRWSQTCWCVTSWDRAQSNTPGSQQTRCWVLCWHSGAATCPRWLHSSSFLLLHQSGKNWSVHRTHSMSIFFWTDNPTENVFNFKQFCSAFLSSFNMLLHASQQMICS